jgi:NAD(P)-dependent dehydrogenase (short-subunit alcohol dehydrogenase family)
MKNDKARKVWFITGASRGLGAEITEAALAAGDTVVATARKPEQITARFGPNDRLIALALDVTDAASIATAVEMAIDRAGRVDVLVNNAGYGVVGAVEESSSEEVRKLYETNVFGLLNVTRALLPHLRKQRSGHILNMSSVGGYRSFAGYGIYCSTKFAVEAISEALHAELEPLGVHVTVIEPGSFRTDFLDASSVEHSPVRIDDYATTAGATRERAQEVNHTQPGDPKKLAGVMMDLVRHPKPPMRLALGSDAVAAIEAKNAFVGGEIDAWRAVSTSTNFAT